MIATDAATSAVGLSPLPFPLERLLQELPGDDLPRSRPADLAAQAPKASPIILIAASAIHESLDAHQVGAAIAEGVHATLPSARVMQMPGTVARQGFVEELVGLFGGRIERTTLLGLHGEVIPAQLGLIGPPGELTAIIAVEAADDDQYSTHERQDPTCASSRSTGQLIQAALDRGVQRIIVQCDAGGTCDGGIGMASALGIRFLDARHSEIAEAGGLLRLAEIDLSHRDRRLDAVSIEAVVDPCSDLLGPQGVARVDGPRTGASQPQVLRLERGLVRYAEVVRQFLGIDVIALPGGGASGGLAAGLVAFAGARLTSRRAFLRHSAALQSCIAAADLVIVVEDRAVPAGAAAGAMATTDPIPAWVARQAGAQGLPVIALNGDTLKSGGESGHPVTPAGDIDVHPVPAAGVWNTSRPVIETVARIRDVSVESLRNLLRGWSRAAT